MRSDNHRTHYCPDSQFTLVSENDAEFELCQCFTNEFDESLVSASPEAVASPMMAEQIWYRTIAALAKVVGTAARPKPQIPVQQPSEVQEEATSLVRVRPR